MYLFVWLLTLLQADHFFNFCRVGELFKENLQNREYVQASQSIMFKKEKKTANLISDCASLYNSIKTIKHTHLIMIFCKTAFTQSYTSMEPQC